MLKEPRNEELKREDIFDEYFRRLVEKEGQRNLSQDTYLRLEKVKKIFEGKTTLEIMIKGTIFFDKDFKKLFTFLNKTYKIGEDKENELEIALRDLDDFQAFMAGNPINFFSEIENEYINYSRVLNAHIFMELS